MGVRVRPIGEDAVQPTVLRRKKSWDGVAREDWRGNDVMITFSLLSLLSLARDRVLLYRALLGSITVYRLRVIVVSKQPNS